MKVTKVHLIVFAILCNALVYAQNDVLRGPQNVLPDGVVDGVVVEDELPVRSRVEYEHVRLADYAKAWRVFSRIDAREKVNTKLFYPYDFYKENYQFPKSRNDISNQGWVRNQERWSLWTIISNHIILGDLTVFKVSSDENPLIEDGYQLKYPIVRKTKDDFFTNSKYRSDVTRCLSFGEPAKPYTIQLKSSGADWIVQKSNSSYERWLDSLTNPTPGGDIYITDDGLSDYIDLIGYHEADSVGFKAAWNAAKDGDFIKREPQVTVINSQAITAYNIKEDWFFDKERSMLDKRIICIAPVGRCAYDPVDNDKNSPTYSEIERFSSFLGVNNLGQLVDGGGTEYAEEFVELELFWLYFPQLRHVLVNYYVYNDQNDAQRMSYDDLFWKRLFSAQVYKKTDQYDRSVEDYRYGVDALYEAEKFKETMRTWETDLWNY